MSSEHTFLCVFFVDSCKIAGKCMVSMDPQCINCARKQAKISLFVVAREHVSLKRGAHISCITYVQFICKVFYVFCAIQVSAWWLDRPLWGSRSHSNGLSSCPTARIIIQIYWGSDWTWKWSFNLRSATQPWTKYLTSPGLQVCDLHIDPWN